MRRSTIEAVLRRDRIIVIVALNALTGLAWLYLVHLNDNTEMAAAGPGRMAMSAMPPAAGELLATSQLALLFAMWAVMMVGMMTPAVAPMVLLYARVGRKAADDGHPFVGAGWFLSGYLLAWTLFAALATLTHAGLAAVNLITPAMATATPLVGAALLVLAGLYQLTPLKDACLVQCRAPLQFIQRHGGFRGDFAGAIGLGLRHGLYCIGCCWPLMLLLFVGGMMNLLWVAALAAVVLMEKLIGSKPVSRFAGLVMILAGAVLALQV